MTKKENKKLSFKERLETFKLAAKWIYQSSPKLVITIFIASFIAGLLVVVSPYIYKLIIDNLTTLNLENVTTVSLSIIGLVIIYVLIIFIMDIAAELTYLLQISTNYRIEKHVSKKLMQKTKELDIEHFEDAEFYDNLYKANQSLPKLTQFFRNSEDAIRYLVSVVAIMITLLIYDWKIFILIVIGTIPNLLVFLRYADIEYSLFYSNSPNRRKAWYFLNLINSDKRAFKEIKLFSLTNIFIKKWDKLFKGIIKSQDKAVKKQIFLYLLSGLFNVLFIFFAIYLSINLYINGEITIGTIVFLLALIFEFSSRLSIFFESFGYINSGLSYIHSFLEVFRYKSKIKTNNKLKLPNKLKKGIELKNVYFKYPKTNKYVLKDINLTIKPGENIAIVGENGCGKTTFIKLISRLYDVTKGKILIEGKNIKDYSLIDLHRNIGVIFQDFVQYEASAKENIKFGNIFKDSKDVHKSAIKSGAYSFIKDLDKTYNQHLGKIFDTKGKELSIGQWQKVALARAFFKDSNILILDEPTAAIDAKAEYELFEKFKRLTKGKTTILISHRFSTVRMADKIIVMDKGKIIEVGSHKELISKKGVYYKLFDLQAKGYKL